MSLKYHIIHFIVKDMEKQLEIDQKKVKALSWIVLIKLRAVLLCWSKLSYLQFQVVSLSIGAACEITFFGSLDQVAANWERARWVPSLPGELPQTGLLQHLILKSWLLKLLNSNRPWMDLNRCQADAAFSTDILCCRQSKSFLFRSLSCSRCSSQTSACARCSNSASKDSGHGDHAENSGLRGGSDGGGVHQWGI